MTRNKLKYCTLGATAIALITMTYFKIPVFREVYGSLCCYVVGTAFLLLGLKYFLEFTLGLPMRVTYRYWTRITVEKDEKKYRPWRILYFVSGAVFVFLGVSGTVFCKHLARPHLWATLVVVIMNCLALVVLNRKA